jgi:hypothetical protein
VDMCSLGIVNLPRAITHSTNLLRCEAGNARARTHTHTHTHTHTFWLEAGQC